MPSYYIKLIKRQKIARNTILFTFEKPEGFTFKPGQYAGFTLIHTKALDPIHKVRRFSFLSTPDEPYLSIAIRMQDSPYKNALDDLPIGGEIKLTGPMGDFTLPNETNVPAVFLAGGIGITPFYSMLKSAITQRSTQPFSLFYGNQSLVDAALLDELTELSRDKKIIFIPTLMDPPAAWRGEKGLINEAMLKKHLPDLKIPLYYLCGSSSMVSALEQMLLTLNISEDRIKKEDFPGY